MNRKTLFGWTILDGVTEVWSTWEAFEREYRECDDALNRKAARHGSGYQDFIATFALEEL